MWTCPYCKRNFIYKPSEHTCRFYTLDDHFIGKNLKLKPIFDFLISKLSNLDNLKIEAVKNTILLKNRVIFTSLTIQKNSIIVKLLLETQCEIFPVYKIDKATKTKFCHYIKLEEIDDVNEQLINWISESYSL
ncbi:DUF5655 domain-containing protein [Bacteroidota bacterium]